MFNVAMTYQTASGKFGKFNGLVACVKGEDIFQTARNALRVRMLASRKGKVARIVRASATAV